jgi:hypothetical protein
MLAALLCELAGRASPVPLPVIDNPSDARRQQIHHNRACPGPRHESPVRPGGAVEGGGVSVNSTKSVLLVSELAYLAVYRLARAVNAPQRTMLRKALPGIERHCFTAIGSGIRADRHPWPGGRHQNDPYRVRVVRVDPVCSAAQQQGSGDGNGSRRED